MMQITYTMKWPDIFILPYIGQGQDYMWLCATKKIPINYSDVQAMCIQAVKALKLVREAWPLLHMG